MSARARPPVLRRETKFLPDGTYGFRDRLQIERALTTRVITGRAWLLEWIALEAGTVALLTGNDAVRSSRSEFWIFYPPFTISRLSLTAAHGTAMGKAGTDPVRPQFAQVPFLFESDAAIHGERIETLLDGATEIMRAEPYPRASSLSRRARSLIVKTYAEEPSIARIAARLGVSHSHLSRQFRQDYEMTPRDYVHQLRIADVPFRLAKGQSIWNVSWAAGYRDLSRFYRQFRKRTQTAPGVCREMLGPRRR